MERWDYSVIWYGDGRTIVWGTYSTEYEAIQKTKSSEAPLQRWRIMKNVYRLDRQEMVTEGLAPRNDDTQTDWPPTRPRRATAPRPPRRRRESVMDVIEWMRGYLTGSHDRTEDVEALRDCLSRLNKAARLAIVTAPAWQDQSIPEALLRACDAASGLISDTAATPQPAAEGEG